MNLSHIDAIMARQSELIAALDTQDALAITSATEALAAAVALCKNAPAGPADNALPERIGEALQQSQAATIRVNMLAHWTRQRIGRIAELRGGTLSKQTLTYGF